MPTTIDVSAMNDDSIRKSGLDHAAAEAERAQHADLLPALDDGARADHAERRDADHEAEAP